MAVTGLDFSLPTIQQRSHDPAFIIMDKRSIDLNKHAFDLNEVPLNEFSLDFHDASSSHELGNSLPTKRGGWLELFRNMFGQDKMVLSGFPFAPRTATLSSDPGIHSSQALRADERQHSDPRIHNSQNLHSVHKIPSGNGVAHNPDTAKQSVTGAGSLDSLLLHHKHNRTRKLPIFDEFNHGNIFCTMPISEHACIGSHDGKPFFDLSGQPGCPNSFLNSIYPTHDGVKLNAGVRQQGCDALGRPQHSDGLHTSFHPSPEQGSVGSSISHGFNHYKAPVPFWDLNSHPIPHWSADFEPFVFSKAPCIADSRHFHSGEYSTEPQAHVMEKIRKWGQCAQVSDMPLTNFRQENGFPEHEMDCKALTCLEKKNGHLCSQKKGRGGSHRGKALESIISKNLPSSSADKEKDQELRVRIIESPDWLPAGWITEVKTRMTGSTAGTTDKYYKDPVTGRRFRSKNEVLVFLQTGRLCRNKPQIKAFEGFAAVTTTMPSLLRRQEQSIGLPDSFEAVAANHTSLCPANDLSSRASVCQSLCPTSAIFDRISVKQEQDDLIQGGLKAGFDGCGILDVATGVEELRTYNLQERPGLEIPEIEESDLSIRPGSSSACVYQEPVFANKRKFAGDCSYRLPSKRLSSTVKELEEQDKWIFCMSPFPREATAQAASSGVEAVDTGIAHSLYPGLLYKQETDGAQDEAVNQYLAARYKANARALGLYDRPLIRSTSQVNLGCIKELRPKTGSMNKNGEKKSPKLTLKQEKDLFVSLGRKLCQEFLASAKESCLQ